VEEATEGAQKAGKDNRRQKVKSPPASGLRHVKSFLFGFFP
jgi:hypothetical protein